MVFCAKYTLALTGINKIVFFMIMKKYSLVVEKIVFLFMIYLNVILSLPAEQWNTNTEDIMEDYYKWTGLMYK